MRINKITLRVAGASLAVVLSLAAQPLRAQASSDDARLQKLEQAVAALQKQNADLKAEVSSLKKHPAPATVVAGEGKTKTEVVYDGKTYVEKVVPVEKSSADKWKISTSTTEMELYGDLRLRYQYNGGETKSTGPVAAPGAGIAGTNDWQERERERYRLRLGLRGTLMDDWFFGVRLETSNNGRSTNVTFGDDTASSTAGGGGPFGKNSDVVYVGQAYAGYKGWPGFTLTAGRNAEPAPEHPHGLGPGHQSRRHGRAVEAHVCVWRKRAPAFLQQGWQSCSARKGTGAVDEARSVRQLRPVRL